MWLIIKIMYQTVRGYNMLDCENDEWKKNFKLVEWFFCNTDFYTRDIYPLGNQLIWHKKS